MRNRRYGRTALAFYAFKPSGALEAPAPPASWEFEARPAVTASSPTIRIGRVLGEDVRLASPLFRDDVHGDRPAPPCASAGRRLLPAPLSARRRASTSIVRRCLSKNDSPAKMTCGGFLLNILISFPSPPRVLVRIGDPPSSRRAETPRRAGSPPPTKPRRRSPFPEKRPRA